MITRSSRKVLARSHVQLDLVLKRDKNGQKRGGARKGAGRPRRPKAGEWHKTRPEVNHAHPQHVTLRVLGAVGHLRRRRIWKAIRTALLHSAKSVDFRVVHMSLQGNHIHLLCEADNKQALSRGVWGFEISAGRHINGQLGRSGQVFADRYHVRSMSSLRQTRNCVSYVLTKGSHCTPLHVSDWPRVVCQTWLLTATIRRFHRRDPRFSHVVLDWSPWRSFPDAVDVELRDRARMPKDLGPHRGARHVDRPN